MLKIGSMRGYKVGDVRAVLIGKLISARLEPHGPMHVTIALDPSEKQLYELTFPRIYVAQQIPSTVRNRILRGRVEGRPDHLLYALCLPSGYTAYHFKDHSTKFHAELKELGWLTKPDVTAIGRGFDVSRSFSNGPKYKIVEQGSFPIKAIRKYNPLQ